MSPRHVSDSNGDYNITGIDVGDYKMREVSQASWTCTSPSPCYYDESFSSGTDADRPRLRQPPRHDHRLGQRHQVAGRQNGDGIRDPGDDGLAGWTFYVDYNDNGDLDPGEPSAVSDSNGDFDDRGHHAR